MTRKDALFITLLYLAWLIATYLINIIATDARTPQEIFEQWVRYDGIYFRAIAEYGYAEASRLVRYQQGFPFLTALFPLFPLLIHFAAPLFGGNYSVASVVVPQILTFCVLIALFNLIVLDFSRPVAWLTALSLMMFPTSYFLLAPYSETLFLLLVILTFYFYRQGRFLPAGMTGALASAARIMGPLLFVTFAFAIIRREGQSALHASRFRSFVARHWPLSLIPLGLVVYMAYLSWVFNDPLVFMRGHASSEWKVGFDVLGPLRGLGLPFYTLLARDWTSATFRANLFNSAFFYFAILMTLYASVVRRQLPFSYLEYALLAIFLPTLTGSLISMPRYVLIAFPMFIGMALLMEAHSRARVLLVVFALCSLIATFLFFKTVFLG